MILFRADANNKIGSGHVMRCLSVAAALRQAGAECAFATADHQADGLLESRGVRHFCLDSHWQDMERELLTFLPLLAQCRPELVVVDSYSVTERYLSALQKELPVMYIDDLNAFTYPVDMLVNYNLYARTMDYCQRYQNTGTKLLLGPSYAPLREEFQNLPARVIHEQAKNVLISTGGADPAGVGLALAEELLRRNLPEAGITCHFILGALNPAREQMQAFARQSLRIVLHENVTDMHALMRMCDAAVSAAGSTLYELCACGTPTVTYVLADNQLPGAAEFTNQRLMLCAGDCREEPRFCEKLLRLLSGLCADSERRKEMSAAMQRVVDGKGAARIAETILRNRLG